MQAEVKFSGFEELERKLTKLAHAFTGRNTREIEREGAEIILNEMRLLAPVRTGALRDSLDITEDKTGVMIGPVRGGAGSRAHFNEFGTVKMAATPFIRPAYDNTQDQVTTTIARHALADVYKATEG